jgi:hypothetical protein
MSSSSASPDRPWEELCRASILGFRAACNAVAAPADRPVKRDFVDRLGALDEAQPVFEAAWLGAGAPGGARDREHFFAQLVLNPSWGTLVLETLERQRRWFHRGKGGTLSRFWEWVEAGITKILNKDSHPLTRVLVLSLASTFTVGGMVVLGNNFDVLTIHVRPVVPESGVSIPVSLVSATQGEALPVKLQGLPIQIPVSLVTSDTNPVRIHLTEAANLHGDGGTDDFVSSVHRLKNSADSLSNGVAALNDLLHHSVGQQPVVLSGLNQIGQEYRALTAAYEEQIRAEQATAARSLTQVITPLEKIASLVRVGQVYGQQRQFALRARSSVSLLLSRLDSDGVSDPYIVLSVCAGAVKHDGRGAFVKVATWVDPDPASASTAAIAGSSRPCHGSSSEDMYVGSPPRKVGATWTMTLNSIDRHWPGGDSVTLSLAPGPGPTSGSMTAGELRSTGNGDPPDLHQREHTP